MADGTPTIHDWGQNAGANGARFAEKSSHFFWLTT